MKDYLSHSFNEDDFDLVSVIDELPLWSAPFGLDLLEVVKLKPNLTALDIGSGLGFPMIELAMRLGESGKVYGIDPWKRAVERTKLKIRVLKIKNAIATRGVVEKMPFDDNYFDLIVSNNGLNNVDNIEEALSECHRVSKPGAQLAFTLNLSDTMMEFYNVLEQVLKANNLFPEIEKMKAHIYAKRKPLREVESLLKISGFKIENIKINNINISFLDGTSMFNHYLIKYWFLDGWKKIVKTEDLEWIFEQVESHINDSAKEKGEFPLSIPFATVDSMRF